jgi:hypothetical protein
MAGSQWPEKEQDDHRNDKDVNADEPLRDVHEAGIEISADRGSDSPIEGHSSRIQESSLSSREKLRLISTFPQLSRESTRLTRRLNVVDFSMLTNRNTIWKDFCEQRTTGTVEEYQRWHSKMHAKNLYCKCYGFDPTCWSISGDKWMVHIKECRHCRIWSNTECPISGHSIASKRTTLIDISERKFMPEKASEKMSCCTKELCTHEFWIHGKIDVPWWACFNRTCAEHYAMKAKNGIEPIIPMVTILNNDKCPCLRKGCICGFNRATLVTPGVSYDATMFRRGLH